MFNWLRRSQAAPVDRESRDWVRQRRPNFVDGGEFEEGMAASLEELRRIPFVARCEGAVGFEKFTAARTEFGYHLMAHYEGGHYWAVAHLRHDFGLPTIPRRAAGR